MPSDITAEVADLLVQFKAAASDPETQRPLGSRLGALYRRKVLSGRSAFVPSEYAPIATLTYSLPASAEADLREVIKGLWKWFIGGLTQLRADPRASFEFVTLFSLTRSDGRLEFRLVSPHPEPIQFMRASDQSMKVGGARPNLGHLSDVDLRHRYAVADGVLAPVVVSYDADQHLLQLVNTFHFQNPGQFLSPWKCRSTSGFLNAIGALSIRESQSKGSPLFLSDLESAMNQGLDEWFRWVYCCIDTGESFDADRLLIRNGSPEQYVYDYPNSADLA